VTGKPFSQNLGERVWSRMARKTTPASTSTGSVSNRWVRPQRHRARSGVVVVRLGSSPVAANGPAHGLHMRAFQAFADALR
jgi:hypothetical protein